MSLNLDMGLIVRGTGDIAKKIIERKAEEEILDASSGGAAQTNIMQTGDCMSDALQWQCRESGKPRLTSCTEGTFGLLAPGWGTMELKSHAEEAQTPAAAPAGSFCGSVPLTLDTGFDLPRHRGHREEGHRVQGRG